jgi:hypothetical protein
MAISLQLVTLHGVPLAIRPMSPPTYGDVTVGKGGHFNISHLPILGKHSPSLPRRSLGRRGATKHVPEYARGTQISGGCVVGRLERGGGGGAGDAVPEGRGLGEVSS